MPVAALIAVVGGVFSGLIFLAPVSGSKIGMLLAQVTPLPLLLVGLGYGTVAATAATVAGGVVIALATGVAVALPFLAVYGLPSLIVTRQALLSRAVSEDRLEWYPVGMLLAILAIYGAAGFLAAELMLVDEIDEIRAAMSAMLTDLSIASAPDVPEELRSQKISEILAIVPAAFLLWWLVQMTANGAFAQALLSAWRRNLRPSPRYSLIRVPILLAPLAGAGLVAALAGGETLTRIGSAVTVVLAVPFFLQGLAVVHVISRLWPGRAFALVAFYLAVVLLPGWFGPGLVTLLGIAEHWAGLRWRFAGDASGEEEV